MMIDIIKHLNRDGYDYLAMPIGDGVADDGPIIQARAYASRFNSGISALPIDGGKFRIQSTVQLNGDESIKHAK